MNNIDLSTLKSGDRIVIRLDANSAEALRKSDDRWPITFSGSTLGVTVPKDCIIEIIKKPEEVSEVIKFLNSSEATYSERSFYASFAQAIIQQVKEEMK